jgi:non-specific serine/threonine protein kinase
VAASSFAALLRGHRLALGLTQEELAERAGLSARAISDLERGLKQMPRPSTVRLLVQGLGLGTADAARLVAAAQGRERERSPTAAAPAPGHLPRQLSSFVGRQQELAELRRLLPTTPLLTLVGPGGVGKTRLALRIAADVLDAGAGPVALVELEGLADGARLPETVSSAVGLLEQPGRSPTAALIDALRQRHLLFLLDNCEHLVDACAALVAVLLAACPGLRILATSREALRIPGETTWRVPPLGLPRLPAGPSPAAGPAASPLRAQVAAAEAVQLFVARAAAARPGFALTDGNAPTVAHICQQVDGLPLAIELAAARISALSVEQLGQRLTDRFGLLSGGNRAARPRQQTLRAAMDWSYDLLRSPERVLFGRLGTFAGGWTLEAAEAVGAGPGVTSAEVLERLCALVDQSLVTVEERAGAERYRLLETVRQYAVERLVASGHDLAARERHAAYFLALAEAAEPYEGPRQAWWLQRLELEHDNVRAALRWYIEQGRAEHALRLAGVLARFWLGRGHLREGRARLTEVLRLGTGTGPGPRTAGRATALRGAGELARRQADFDVAHALYEESLAIWRDLGDQQGIASSLNDLGNLASHQGNYAAAQALYQESLAIRRELGERVGIASSLTNLGRVASHQGDHATARSLHEESLAMFRELGDTRGIADVLINLGEVAQDQGDRVAAQRLFHEGMVVARELENPVLTAYALDGLAAVAASQGQAGRALRLAGVAARLRESAGARPSPADQRWLDRNLQPARQLLSEEAGAAAWAHGQAMAEDDAFVYALEPT